LWPTAAFNGLYNSGKVLLGFQYHRLKQLLGWEVDTTPGSQDAKYTQLLQLLQAQQAQQAEQAKSQPSGAGTPEADKSQTFAATVGSQGASTSFDRRDANRSTYLHRHFGPGQDAQEDGATERQFYYPRTDPAEGQQIYLDVRRASFL
jgi:hypothetical protein